MKTVRIYGTAPNLSETPPPIEGEEIWMCNFHRIYNKRLEGATKQWTRWFNLHSRRHQLHTYPGGFAWYQKQTKPIYMQDVQHDVPASVRFPREAVQEFFNSSYFTCSACWLIAFAIYEGFERIELWGFRIIPTKRRSYTEREGVMFWIEEAKRRGVEVVYQPDLLITPAGDPTTYDGPIYGYETT